MKRLFRVLCVDSIILVFKNLLLGRGVYIIGRNPRTAFDIIEALTSLLYPLKWEHPRILSYESKYEIFESPIPLIYYFDSERFDHGTLAKLDLTDKCILYADSNGVREFCANIGLKELPAKPTTNLQKSLSKVVGTYTAYYAGKRGSMTFSEFDKMLEIPDDSVPFDYWKIRECFFDFMNELLSGYQECYRESQIFSGLLVKSDSFTIFDFTKFIKMKSGLKNSNFVDSFCRTSLFSRLVECRVHPETVEQEEYYNYFDLIQKQKLDQPKLECFSKFGEQISSKPLKYTEQPYMNEFVSQNQICYAGKFPNLNPDLFFITRFEHIPTYGMAVDEEEDLKKEEYILKFSDEKWAKQNIEMLFTVWFLSLKVFMKQPVNPQYCNLVNFAYDKLIEMEAEKYQPSIDVIKSAAFMLGIFREGSKIARIIRKFSKVIEATGQLASIYGEYIQGSQVKILSQNASNKQVKYKSSNHEQDRYTQAQLDSFTIKELDEDERDEHIPVAIKSYFETNTFCSICQTYIPEEIILAKMKRDPKSTHAVCPNQACSAIYEPVFNCLFLKQKGSKKAQESVKLLSPLNLLLELKEFLKVNDPVSIMNVDLFSLRALSLGYYIGTFYFIQTF